MIKATIVYLVDPNTREVLMAKKTRKIGVGYWFGYGGKIEDGESPEACTVREVHEETGGVVIDPTKLEPVALMDFYNKEDMKPGVDDAFFRVLCYRIFVDKTTINPFNTEQMADPNWFPIDNLPTGAMKPGDELFVPQILSGTTVRGYVHFSDDSKWVIGSDIVPARLEDLVI